MKTNKLIILFIFFLSSRGFCFAEENKTLKFSPMRYQHICHLVKGQSPWKTLSFAPLVNPKTIELEAMFSFLIGEWREPSKWVYHSGTNKGQLIPHHSIRVYLYPVNDKMVSPVNIEDIKMNRERSFIGEFSDLDGATAFAVFVYGTKKVHVFFKYDYESDREAEKFQRFDYECEYNNPSFNPAMWVGNERFGSTVKQLVIDSH